MEQAVINKRCVTGWSYKLASAPGANRDVAEAAAQACVSGIEYEAAQLAERDYVEVARFEAKERKQRELTDRYTKEALLATMRARAGQCVEP